MDNDEVTGTAQSEPTDMYSKEHVTELVKREKDAAYRKAQREYQAQIDAIKSQQSSGVNADEIASLVDAKLQQRLAEEQERAKKAREEQERAESERFVKENVEKYVSKMRASTNSAEDFQDTISKFDPSQFQEIFFIANGFENTPEIIYELRKNPYKLANIDYLARTNPDLAREEIERLSRSIEHNQQALENAPQMPSPLSRGKPSLGAGTDKRQLSLADKKKLPFLRG